MTFMLMNGTLMGVVPSGSRFDFYVTDSSVLAVVVAEELVDGVDVQLGKIYSAKKVWNN